VHVVRKGDYTKASAQRNSNPSYLSRPATAVIVPDISSSPVIVAILSFNFSVAVLCYLAVINQRYKPHSPFLLIHWHLAKFTVTLPGGQVVQSHLSPGAITTT